MTRRPPGNDRALAASDPFRMQTESTFRNASIEGGEPPLWVKTGNRQNEQIYSARPRKRTRPRRAVRCPVYAALTHCEQNTGMLPTAERTKSAKDQRSHL